MYKFIRRIKNQALGFPKNLIIIGFIIASFFSFSTALADRTFSLPDQTSHSGQFLQTNGVNPLWATAGGGGGSGTVTSIAGLNSIVSSPNPITGAGTLSLVNDTATPGNSKYYGTNGSGTLGYFNLSAALPALLQNHIYTGNGISLPADAGTVYLFSNLATDIAYGGTNALHLDISTKDVRLGFNTGNPGSNQETTEIGNGAGTGSTAILMTLIGSNAGGSSTSAAARLTAGGRDAGASSTGALSSFWGASAGANNHADDATCIGNACLFGNIGVDSSADGQNSLNGNTGARASGFGNSAGFSQSGADAISLGWHSGISNIFHDVVQLGSNSVADKNNEFVVGNSANPLSNWQINGVDYVMPSGSYVAGGALTDVAGNGTLSWVVPGGGGGGITNIATTGPITGGPITSTGTISITQSDTSTDGYLSSTDWNTFNNKVSAPVYLANQIPRGDGTTAGGITSTSLGFNGVLLNLADAVGNTFINAGGTGPSAGGGQNIGIGANNSTNTLSGLSTGTFNIAIGAGTATGISTGDNNIILGNGAGTGIGTGSDLIVIGRGSTVSPGGSTNSVVIGAGATSAMSNEFVFGSGINNWRVNGQPWILPSANTAGAFTNDGSGNLSWSPIVPPPIYAADQIVRGDGSTPGGIATSDFTFTSGNAGGFIVNRNGAVTGNLQDWTANTNPLAAITVSGHFKDFSQAGSGTQIAAFDNTGILGTTSAIPSSLITGTANRIPYFDASGNMIDDAGFKRTGTNFNSTLIQSLNGGDGGQLIVDSVSSSFYHHIAGGQNLLTLNGTSSQLSSANGTNTATLNLTAASNASLGITSSTFQSTLQADPTDLNFSYQDTAGATLTGGSFGPLIAKLSSQDASGTVYNNSAQIDNTGLFFTANDVAGGASEGINIVSSGISFAGSSGSYTFPTNHGSAGQALVDDGSGNLSFGTPTAGVPTLTATQVAYGDGSNLMTSNTNFTYDPINGFTALSTDSSTFNTAFQTNSTTANIFFQDLAGGTNTNLAMTATNLFMGWINTSTGGGRTTIDATSFRNEYFDGNSPGSGTYSGSTTLSPTLSGMQYTDVTNTRSGTIGLTSTNSNFTWADTPNVLSGALAIDNSGNKLSYLSSTITSTAGLDLNGFSAQSSDLANNANANLFATASSGVQALYQDNTNSRDTQMDLNTTSALLSFTNQNTSVTTGLEVSDLLAVLGITGGNNTKLTLNDSAQTISSAGTIVETNIGSTTYGGTLNYSAGFVGKARAFFSGSHSGTASGVLLPTGSIAVIGTKFTVDDLGALATTDPITLDAGSGNTITSTSGVAQTFILNANGESVTIVKLTNTQWMVE